MKVTAKCHNYSGCIKAYRGEIIELEPGVPLVCPECSKPMTIATSAGSGLIKGGVLIGVLAALVGAAAYFGPSMREKKPEPDAGSITKPSETESASKAPVTEPATKPIAGESAPTKPVSPTKPVTAPDPATAPEAIVVPTKIDLNLGTAENKNVKTEVLDRVDAMPNISQSNKDRLTLSVERARRMGKVLTIPFGSGKTALVAEETQALKTQLDSTEIVKLRDDPTAVFVILGYADPKGDKAKNLTVSQARADSVLAAMRDKCGIVNVMHSVAMGGSTLLDAQNLEKNRIVEVWAVLP